MEYRFSEIEATIQAAWREEDIYKVEEDAAKPAYYVLDMFPYPSGAGLHMGHPLGYTASDIFARYKRLKGFSVLHPMGFDAFGLPAEQYAIQTGQHPAETTRINSERYRKQLDRIGFSFDWSRQVVTSDPSYYKWTQWVFSRLFEYYYDTKEEKAKPVKELIDHLEKYGTKGLNAYSPTAPEIDNATWNQYDEAAKSNFLMHYRLAYLGESMVNWCPELGTVLANDEVSEGISIRGGYPVIQRKMTQWCLRISAYGERLLKGLEELEWTDALKETQRNWIGRSEGAELHFQVQGTDKDIAVFTTRIDTIYGVSFLVLAPEHELVDTITTDSARAEVDAYIADTKRKTERERMADRRISGAFTGAYALHPLTREALPIWIADYVLAGYGTGAVMAVAAHDTRDFAFARHFNLPIRQVICADGEEPTTTSGWEDAQTAKEGHLVNSDQYNGLSVREATQQLLDFVEEKGIGKRRITYRLRDAIFSRQRYWGEPFPIYYKDHIPHLLSNDKLPLELPPIDSYKPTKEGIPPLGRAKNWCTEEGYPFELSTMPGFAGSSAYYLRYMDPHNETALVGKKANEYWRHVDLYIGGTEHATGHLLYSRFWCMFLYDLGLVCEAEPYRRLVNQGMIQGKSCFVYRIKDTNRFVTLSQKDKYETTAIHADINLVKDGCLDIEAFRAWRPEFENAEFILEADNTYQCGTAIEKMSKSMYNVVNPDDVIDQYGADTLRLYLMFLGPLEQSKPWDTKGIEGVHRFLKRLMGLFWKDEEWIVTNEKASSESHKTLHKLIKKVGEDIESISLNTAVSAFMIALNELSEQQCHSTEILEPLLIVLSPFAPHLTDWLYRKLGHDSSIVVAEWPKYDESILVESEVTYPISFNGKVRFKLALPADSSKEQIETAALSSPEAAKWLEGKTPRKVIVVPGRIVNIVI